MKKLAREDYLVTTRDSVEVRVRTVAQEGKDAAPVILLVHGVSAPLEPTYDLRVPGYSFMEMLAERGYRSVALDHRNFGGSTRSAELSHPPTDGFAHTLDDSLEDIRAVIEDCRSRFDQSRVVLFGSSRAALQVVAFAAQHSDLLSLVIANNPSSAAYLSGVSEGPLVEERSRRLAESLRPVNYINYTEEVLFGRWDKLFGDKILVPPDVQKKYVESCLATDAESSKKNPPCFRVPTEKIPDLNPLVSLDSIRVPCLVTDAEERPADHIAAFRNLFPPNLLSWQKIEDSDHFTLRNPKRFELANLVDLAVTGATKWRGN